jgi:hypothetical protein
MDYLKEKVDAGAGKQNCRGILLTFSLLSQILTSWAKLIAIRLYHDANVF